MKRVWRLAAPAALALSVSAMPAAALATSAGGSDTRPAADEAAGAVRAISIVPGAGRTEVVIAVDGGVTIKDFTVDKPYRVVLDLHGARLGMATNSYDRVQRGGITNVRLSQFNPTTVRVVLDLDGPREYSVLNGEGDVRVAISGAADFTAWSSSPQQQAAPLATVGGAVVAEATASPTAAPTPRAPTNRTDARALAVKESAAAASNRPAVERTTLGMEPGNPLAVSNQRRITVTYEDADIRDVLAAFAVFSGRTIITGRDVKGEVTAEIKDQPWDVALGAILNAQGLAAMEDVSGIITVDSYANILLKQSSEPIVTRLVQVNYVPAGSLVETVRSLLSKDCTLVEAAAASGAGASASKGCNVRGQVTADSATNTLLVSEVPSRLGELLNYVQQLDVRTPQVSIKAKVISVNRSATEQLGLSYDLGSAQGFYNRLAQRSDEDGTPIEGDFVVELGGNALTGVVNANRRYGGAQSSALNLIFSTAIGKFSLTSFLDALTEHRLSDIQAEPQVTTLDNRRARVLVGQETPVRVIDYGTGGVGSLPRANVQFRETGIILEVTPHITSNRHILMDVYAEQSELQIVGGDLGFFMPKRNVRNQVIVRDGETMALGGLTQTQVFKHRTGIPILSDLPLIGRLFSQTETREEKADLLILLTPHIIDEVQR